MGHLGQKILQMDPKNRFLKFCGKWKYDMFLIFFCFFVFCFEKNVNLGFFTETILISWELNIRERREGIQNIE